MISSFTISIRYSSVLIIFLFSITACTHYPPRVNRDGTPQREYSYQSPIKIDDGWQVSSLAKEGVNEEIILDLMKTILTGKYPNVRSILLIRNGSLILEEYFYHYQRYLIQDFRSGSKSITSELVGIAIDKGFIKSVNEKLFDYFPEFEKGTNWDKRKDEILLHHALSMTWGIDQSGPANYAIWYTENWITDILNLPLVREPGMQFEYHSAAPALFGPIIEHTSGISVSEFARKYLFEPLNISSYQWYIFPDGSEMTAGALWIRPRDMAKFGYLILSGGQWHGKQILSEEWINKSTRPYTSDNELGYGYYWWLSRYKGGNHLYETIFAAGHGGQRVMVVPELNLVAVFTSKPDDNPKGHTRILQIMEKYILPSMLDSGP